MRLEIKKKTNRKIISNKNKIKIKKKSTLIWKKMSSNVSKMNLNRKNTIII